MPLNSCNACVRSGRHEAEIFTSCQTDLRMFRRMRLKIYAWCHLACMLFLPISLKTLKVSLCCVGNCVLVLLALCTQQVASRSTTHSRSLQQFMMNGSYNPWDACFACHITLSSYRFSTSTKYSFKFAPLPPANISESPCTHQKS